MRFSPFITEPVTEPVIRRQIVCHQVISHQVIRYLAIRVLVLNLIVLFLVISLSGCSSLPGAQGVGQASAALPQPWPPQLGKEYPDLKLKDASGNVVALSKYKGKVILLEPIGMSCPACQAFCGATSGNSYGDVSPQANLPAMEAYLKQQGIDPEDPNLVRVQLLLYNLAMQAPTQSEAKKWTDTFAMSNEDNVVTLVGQPEFISEATYNLIPGFQLIDQDFVLRSDSTGHHPASDLYRELVPSLKQLLSKN
jgi:hypothetical protein